MSNQKQQSCLSTSLGAVVLATLGAIPSAYGQASGKVIAFDCEAISIAGVSRTYRRIQNGGDINAGRFVVFADENGVYWRSLEIDTPPPPQVVAQRGDILGCTGEAIGETSIFRTALGNESLQRISSDNCVAFLARLTSGLACPPLSCEQSGPAGCNQSVLNAIVRGGGESQLSVDHD